MPRLGGFRLRRCAHVAVAGASGLALAGSCALLVRVVTLLGEPVDRVAVADGIIGMAAAMSGSLLVAMAALIGLLVDRGKRIWYIAALIIAHSAWVAAFLQMFLLAAKTMELGR